MWAVIIAKWLFETNFKRWNSVKLCNSFEDGTPVDEIYMCPVFKWVDVTSRQDMAQDSSSNGREGDTTCCMRTAEVHVLIWNY